MRFLQFMSCVLLGSVWTTSLVGQAATDVESPNHYAWDMLMTAAFSKRADDRAKAVRALGLLQGNTQARQLAEQALSDRNSDVRQAAATSLGKMQATESIPKLEHALSDRKIPVVMAAAQSLRELKDYKSAYAIYYDFLTGERKTNDGIVAQQMETLKDPKQLAMIGFSEGIGFVPFAGIGWDAWRTMHKKDPNPVRAVAASFLAHDPDPATGDALVKATQDKNWIVRAAAVEAIAQRGDASLLPHVSAKCSDKNAKVRYAAAAAVIRLSAIEQSKTARNIR